jgi:hypothetical protein
MDEEDPQVALSRPVSLAVNARSTASQPSSAAPSVQRPLIQMPATTPGPQIAQPPTASAVPSNQPQVAELGKDPRGGESITVSQEYVNKVVRSVAALRSAVVGRRTPPVLNERSFR